MCIEKDGVRIETVNGDANCLGVKILPDREMDTGASGKYDVGNKSDSFGQQLQPMLHKAATWIIIIRLRWRRASLSLFTGPFFSFLHEESVIVDVVTIQLLVEFPTS